MKGEVIVEVVPPTVQVPPSVVILKDRTRRLYLCWWMTHYAVGFIGVLAGTVLTALTAAGNDSTPGGLASYAWLIGIVAAVSTSLVTFLGPIHKAERYWSAYHILDQACLEYEQGFIELRPFLLRVRQARRILQAVDPDERFSGDAQKDAQPRSPARGAVAT